jgi:beta-glucosidase
MVLPDEVGERGLLAALSLDDKIRVLTGADNWRTRPLPAIGLAAMTVSDGPAGVRGVTLDERSPSASLPCPSALGATWDPELVGDVAEALGDEARSKGVNMLLGPTINMMRTPLGGRGFESFGEDPVLVAGIAAGYVRGLQRAGVAATLKHFIGNDSETGRWIYDVRMAEHVLREVYLVPFEACVKQAEAELVMAGYNKVNGVTMTEHAWLLTAMLRDEWEFPGVVISDWHAARSTVGTALAGLDLSMPGPDGPWGEHLADAVRSGTVSETDIDTKVLRILRLARRVGALSVEGNGSAAPAADGKADGKVVLADPMLLRRAATAGFTLLRNENGTLPLDPASTGRLAVIGPNAVNPVTQGGGSATVSQVSVSTPAAALTAALPGVIVAPGCVTWSSVPEPSSGSLHDPVTGEQGIRLEFRAADGTLAMAEHRYATMFTWWDGLPDGIGWGGTGMIVLRARYQAQQDGPHLIGAGGFGDLTLTLDDTVAASGNTGIPADPVEVMVRPAEVRATSDLRTGQEVDITISLLPADWAEGPVAIRLGITPATDEDELLEQAVSAARDADAAVVVVGSSPATESEGFDRPGLALPGRQDELIRRVAAVNDRTIVVVNAGMPVLMPWAEHVAAVGYAWLPGQSMGDALADVLLGRAEPGGRLPVTIPRAEADCPVLHAEPAEDGILEYTEGLLIGYRGYDRAGTIPHFPFGHGLGYTSWEYESARVSGLDVTVTIRNTGTRPGREVVQAYVEPQPGDPARPLRTLAAFGTAEAAPGQTVEVPLTLPHRAFARYDEGEATWIWPRGEYTIRIGRSSRDMPLSLMTKSGFLS